MGVTKTDNNANSMPDILIRSFQAPTHFVPIKESLVLGHTVNILKSNC